MRSLGSSRCRGFQLCWLNADKWRRPLSVHLRVSSLWVFHVGLGLDSAVWAAESSPDTSPSCRIKESKHTERRADLSSTNTAYFLRLRAPASQPQSELHHPQREPRQCFGNDWNVSAAPSIRNCGVLKIYCLVDVFDQTVPFSNHFINFKLLATKTFHQLSTKSQSETESNSGRASNLSTDS